MNLFIDIETHPDMNPDALDRHIFEVEAPGNYKKPESIAEWKAQNATTIGTKNWSETALDPMVGGIYVIGVSINGLEPVTYTRQLEDAEGPYLVSALSQIQELANKLGQPRDDVRADLATRWIGWNLLAFDIPFLAKRCVINGIVPALRIPTASRYNTESVCDLMQTWCGTRHDEWRGQKSVAAACGITVDSDLDGKRLWEHGVEKAAEKCRSDLTALIGIYERMKPVFRV